ncbi:MAG: CDP-glycerol glycerophosphotransferase family protein [bacterium]|nr:CDP-glycerol glycerophosphotransferase family protein [bacterium]
MIKKIKYFIEELLSVKQAHFYNYSKVIERLRNKKTPLNVVFICCENQKWGYQDIYDIFSKDERFNPLILVSLHRAINSGHDKAQNPIEENYNFYKSRGLNVDYLYKDGKYLDLKDFEPDIVFYEQPWGLEKQYKPKAVSEYALTFYSPYSIPIFDFKPEYIQRFHRHLYKYFVDSELNVERFEGYRRGNSKNCKVVGYTKLDAYLENKEINVEKIWKNPDKFKIIYAPHHSFAISNLHTGTFGRNGKLILDLAKKHPETTWIFKPHPRFKLDIIKNQMMSEDEINDYFSEWEKIGKVYTKGDYFDIFKTSDMMITDCCSFLGEYLPTKKPLIRITNKGAVELNKLGKEIVKGYYQVETNEELENEFIKLVENRIDDKKELRESLVKNVIDFNEKSADKIFNFITGIIYDKKTNS